MTLTLKDVAAAAGVSTAAVSRSFTPGAPIADETRARVQEIAAKMGYRPNRLAAGLASGRTRLVALVAEDFAAPLTARALDATTRALQAEGLRPILLNLADDMTPEAVLAMIRDYGVEVSILLTPTLPLPFVRAVRDAGVPMIHAFARPTEAAGVSVAAIKDAAAGRLAARTLIERGYIRLAHIGGPEAQPCARDRLAGFRNGAAALGHEIVPIACDDWSFAAGRTAMADLLAGSAPDGIFAACDTLAMGALSLLSGRGLPVPDAIGILGFDDCEMAAWEGIRLTTIRQPVLAIAAACARMAAALADDPAMPPSIEVFVPEIVERDTLRAV